MSKPLDDAKWKLLEIVWGGYLGPRDNNKLIRIIRLLDRRLRRETECQKKR